MKHFDAASLMDAQNALGFVMPAFYNVESTVYQTKYDAFDYAALVPVVREGNEWAVGTMFYSGDIAGQAKFLSGKGFDMPFADVSRTQFLHGYELGGIGYEWTLEEIQRAAMAGRQLGNEKAMAAKKVSEKFLWDIAMTGDTERGWTGLLNDSNVTAADVAGNGDLNGGTDSTFWAHKTADQIVEDVNSGIETIVSATRGQEIPNTLLLPNGGFGLMSKRIPDTQDTIGSFLARNNRYTARTGQALLIRELFELDDADAGGDGRAVLYNRSPDVLRFHLPMAHRFLTPFQKSSMTWEVGGILRTGGTEVRLPKAMLYMDGIVDS